MEMYNEKFALCTLILALKLVQVDTNHCIFIKIIAKLLEKFVQYNYYFLYIE